MRPKFEVVIIKMGISNLVKYELLIISIPRKFIIEHDLGSKAISSITLITRVNGFANASENHGEKSYFFSL